ncbi:hypothetical protein M569_11976 [Genlisea aurea]|uniref:Transmembrane protein n=1 Tax=Genlisea aurea TaxID=192259 RepID=S8DIX3_9LAMI|nr:hypothetical protein M569_11976 [Genlisea aurea]
MADWGPVVIATVLFVLLAPGFIVMIPGSGRFVEFGFSKMASTGIPVLVHTVIYFVLVTILLVAVGVHIYAG